MNVTTRSLARITSIFQHITRSSVMFTTSSSDKGGSRSITENNIEVNGALIHYDKTGVGKHAVLLMPGALGCSKTDFMPQLKNMNHEIFTLYAWDPRGYGKSRPPERDWPLHFLGRDADDAAAMMTKLGVNNYFVLGWSDGGITAMILAARNPEKVKKLVVWGANAYVAEADMPFLEGLRDLGKWSDRMKQPFLDVYGEEYFEKQWGKWVDAYRRYLTDNKGDICKDDLKNIACQTLIIHGQKDALCPQFHPDYIRANIQGSRLINWPEAKHNLHMRHYKEFNSLVEQFLLLPDEEDA